MRALTLADLEAVHAIQKGGCAAVTRSRARALCERLDVAVPNWCAVQKLQAGSPPAVDPNPTVPAVPVGELPPELEAWSARTSGRVLRVASTIVLSGPARVGGTHVERSYPSFSAAIAAV